MNSVARSLNFDEQPLNVKSHFSLVKKEIIGSQERDKLLNGIFGRGRNPESYFLYKGKGTDLYEQVIADEKYVYYQRGIDLISNNRNSLLKYIKKNLTDQGSWTGLKSSILLEHINHHVNYIPVDYSYEMLEVARSTLSKNWHVNTKEWIIITGDSSNLVQWLEDNTYLYTWGTIGNFDTYKNVQDFKNMGNTSYFKGNNIIFDYFCAPTQEELDTELYPAYYNESAKDWFENWLDMLWLSKEDFEFHVEYIRTPAEWILQNGKKVFPGYIQSWFRAKRDVAISLDNHTVLSVKQWEFRPILSSRRFSDAEIDNILQQSGCKKLYVDLQQERGMHLVVAKKLPSKYEQHKHKIRNTALVALGAALMWWWTSFVNEKKHTTEFKQAQEEFSEGKKIRVYDTTTPIDIDINESEVFATTVDEAYSYLSAMFDFSSVSNENKQSLHLLLSSDLSRLTDEGVVYASNLLKPTTQWGIDMYSFITSFVDSYRPVLANWWISVSQPYEHIKKYTDQFQSTLDLQGEIQFWVSLKPNRYTTYTSEIREIESEINTTKVDTISRYTNPKDPIYMSPNPPVTSPNVFVIQNFVWTYKHSNGDNYLLIWVSRRSPIYKERGPYLMASKIQKQPQSFANFSLNLGKEVIRDFNKEFSEQQLKNSEKDIIPYRNLLDISDSFEKTLSLEGEAVWKMATRDGISLPLNHSLLLAENSTKYFHQNPPKHIVGTAMMDIFEQNKMRFDFDKDIWQYRHSDGRLFQLILVDKHKISGHQEGDGPFLFAADISSYDSDKDMPVFDYKLSLWKEVIKDYLLHRKAH